MEEARDSSKTQSDDLGFRKHLLYEFFLSKFNINSYDTVDENNLTFLKNLSNDSLLYHTFRKSRESIVGDLTLDIFLDDLIHTIKVLHFQIVEETSKINKMKANTRVIQAIMKKIEDKKREVTGKDDLTQISISYVKDKKYESEIFKICRLKYKVSTNVSSESMQSIYSEKKNRICLLNVPPELNMMFIHILGKKVDTFIEEKDFNVIATASVPLMTLYS